VSTQPVGTSPAGYNSDDVARLHIALDPDDYRGRFARDYDRLVHTSAFRRLQGKTQVITPGEADFFRTRLTHSIEVAQVARRLAEKLGANPDLCEASAILHDLGHPPFGHVGEVELNKAIDRASQTWQLGVVSDVGGFNGNAQSFRLAVKTLSQSSQFRGLDLTRAVLDGAIKYPYQRNEPGAAPKSEKSWCFYPTEAADATWVRQGISPKRQFKQSFEAQVVDWADDVTYSIHDVEDWYRAGFMPLEMLAQSPHFRDEFATRLGPNLASTNFNANRVTAEVKTLFSSLTFAGITKAYDGTAEVKEGIRTMRKQLFNEFTNVQLADSTAPPTRHNNDLEVDPLVRLRNQILKQLLWEFVIGHPRMATYQLGQARVIKELFELHVEALAYDPSTRQINTSEANLEIFPPDVRGDLQNIQIASAERLRLVADHIAGMTDDYAIRLHGRLTGAVSGVFNAFV
jgi:dGTPase